jgi:hypothetical protein
MNSRLKGCRVREDGIEYNHRWPSVSNEESVEVAHTLRNNMSVWQHGACPFQFRSAKLNFGARIEPEGFF